MFLKRKRNLIPPPPSDYPYDHYQKDSQTFQDLGQKCHFTQKFQDCGKAPAFSQSSKDCTNPMYELQISHHCGRHMEHTSVFPKFWRVDELCVQWWSQPEPRLLQFSHHWSRHTKHTSFSKDHTNPEFGDGVSLNLDYCRSVIIEADTWSTPQFSQSSKDCMNCRSVTTAADTWSTPEISQSSKDCMNYTPQFPQSSKDCTNCRSATTAADTWSTPWLSLNDLGDIITPPLPTGVSCAYSWLATADCASPPLQLNAVGV